MQSREKGSYQKMVSCFFLCPDADCSRINLWELEKLNLWTKLTGLSGEYQSLVVMRMSVILLRLIYSDLNLCPINNRQGIVIDGEGSKVICKD